MLAVVILASTLSVAAGREAPKIKVAQVVVTPTPSAGDERLPGDAGILHPPEGNAPVLPRGRMQDVPGGAGVGGIPGSLPGGAGSLPPGGAPGGGAGGRPVEGGAK